MRLDLHRHWFTEESTSGILRVDGTWFCWTLEDVARAEGVKVAGATCIPAGEYTIVLDYSSRFQRIMPHILDVPRFLGVRIHAGNTDKDTEGCILVGCERAPDHVWRSRDAFDALFVKMKDAVDVKGEKIHLAITNEPL